jgi:ABC-type nitrate/sulfonate/bicarbonate transport system substrate-binding protein
MASTTPEPEKQRSASLSRRDLLRGGLVLGASALAAPILSACGSTSSGSSVKDGATASASGSATATSAAATTQAKAAKFSLGYQSTPDSGFFYLAQQNGWFQQAGIDPDLIYFTTGPALIQGMASGKPNVGHVGSVPVLQAAASGIFPIRIIDIMADVGAGYSIVTQKGITSVEQLKGKKIGLGVGTNDQYFLDAVLKKYGMTESDVEMVNFNPVNRQQAFLSGNIPAVIPLIENRYALLKQGVDAHIMFEATQFDQQPNPVQRPLIFDFIVASQDTLDANHDAYGGLVKVFNETAINYVTESSTKEKAVGELVDWSTNVIKNPTTADAVEKKIATYTFYKPVSKLQELISSGTLLNELQNQAEFLVKIGQSKSVPDFSTVLVTDFMQALS